MKSFAGIGWITAFALTALFSGISWLLTPIELPLYAVLLLTFVPTQEINQALQSPIKRFQD